MYMHICFCEEYMRRVIVNSIHIVHTCKLLTALCDSLHIFSTKFMFTITITEILVYNVAF